MSPKIPNATLKVNGSTNNVCASRSFSSLPFISSQQSISTFNSTQESQLGSNTCPKLREIEFGTSLANRNQFLSSLSNLSNGVQAVGPSDLVHRAIYAGTRSALYHHLDFKGEPNSSENTVDDDGYVGYYHYVNGIRFEGLVEEIEAYVVELLGLVQDEAGYAFKGKSLEKLGTSSKREIIVTYCSFNIFNRSDFRVRFVVQPNGAGVNIDKSYQIIPSGGETSSRKSMSYNNESINQLPPGYWEELRASHLIRLFHHVDNPEYQLVGTVNYTNYIDTYSSLVTSMKILIKFLPRASMTGSRSGYGNPTSCGNNKSGYKTNQYRNKLVDTLLRLVSLDLSGDIVDVAIDEIRGRFYMQATHGAFDYVILLLLKNKSSSNNQNELEYLSLINSSIQFHGLYTTQSGLLLLDQVNFLICKHKYDLALTIAQKCVLILPLDFDCWYYLALCYILCEKYSQALLVINSFPINIRPGKGQPVKDLFINSFLSRLSHSTQDEEIISEKSFFEMFPNPKITKSGKLVDEASIGKMWHDLFLFNPHLRHPIMGTNFTQSTVVNSSPLEIASVDTSLIKIYGPNSTKNLLASQSEGVNSSSMTKFMRKSVWGRSYDLLSMMVALIGWDAVVAMKETLFKPGEVEQKEYTVDHSSIEEKLVPCEPWLEQLFVIIYEDLRVLMVSISNNKSQQRSALEWSILGSIGWNVKYNLRESLSSIDTSIIGTNIQGSFDYFGIVQVLEIYDEFTSNATGDDYDGLMYSNKLIITCLNKSVENLIEEYLSLDFILLCLIKLVSWNVRWYQYVPEYRVIKILTKLLIQYDSIYLMTRIKIIFEQNKNQSQNKRKFSLGGLLKKEEEPKKQYEFDEQDTIFEYMERLLNWLDNLK
ncbi:Chitin biosynthesis protein CHS6 [Spathaspora sp. JA1]|nr:Chitin biosynthesis protein CHS6 [Spathaspora sp. JA1]